MKKTRRLKKNYEFNYALKKGKHFSGKYIECFYLKNKKNINYIGIAISSKLCNAVKRNKIKRIIREAYTSHEKNVSDGNTFVFLWKKKVEVDNCSFYNVLGDLEYIFKAIGIYVNEESSDNIN